MTAPAFALLVPTTKSSLTVPMAASYTPSNVIFPSELLHLTSFFRLLLQAKASEPRMSACTPRPSVAQSNAN